MSDENAPKAYCCPLTLNVMEDPVRAPDGNTYERGAILQELEIRGISPITRQEMNQSQLIPNRAVKDAIRKWRENPNANEGSTPNPNEGSNNNFELERLRRIVENNQPLAIPLHELAIPLHEAGQVESENMSRDDKLVSIGHSSTNVKTMAIPANIFLDGVYLISKEDRVNKDFCDAPDCFRITVDGTVLKCERTDCKWQWGMNLHVRLPANIKLYEGEY